MENSQSEFSPTRLLHTMLRVRSLDQSVDFYTNNLGMRELRKKDYEDGKFTLAFLGYGCEDQNTVLELTYNWDESIYDIGTAYGHIALAVEDIYRTCAFLKQNGVKIVREPSPMKFDALEIIAFIEDPDGYKIELIQRS